MTTDIKPDWETLDSELLCAVEFYLDGALIPIGKSPWRNRRVGYISGGVFSGPRFSGEVLPGGGNWSEVGVSKSGENLSTFDARTVWRTHDGATVYVTHEGRGRIAPDVAAEFADPEKGFSVDKSRYYFRVVPIFETADPRYDWLNSVVTVACGQRIPKGIRYTVFAIK